MAEHRMVSLERKRDSATEVAESNEPFFPHSMFLENEDIEKLGVQDAELGDEFQFLATARVTSVSVDENDSSGKRSSFHLAFVEGELNKPVRSQAERMFGGRDAGS